jgi:hypothetical protein
MRTSTVVLLGLVGLAGCNQSASDRNAAANAASNAAAEKPRNAYCFFKDEETKEWSAARSDDGNIAVKGKAFRQDSRYKAMLGEPEVEGTTARISPTIAQNDTGYGAPDNWWELSATIPNSAAVTRVRVECGAKLLADLEVPSGH